MSTINLYNTKTRTVEEFMPIQKGKVGIYSCGPTVYNYVHIGNLRSYIFSDMIRRMFEHAHYDVQQIVNITDIGHLVTDGDDGEDKMTNALKREGKPLTLTAMRDVANFYFEKFKDDMSALNILPASEFPFASDNIKEDITLIDTLLAKGHAYSISDGVYFDISTFPQYEDFAHLNLKGQEGGARVEENKEKRNAADFAIWKFNNELGYDASFGKGFPGWHIECSAMSMKYLGNHFDIHTGGIDHIPVHHTNEIAQSECATGETYANYWMHNNFVNDTTGKMSKSKGEFLTLNLLKEKGYNPLAYRYFLLTTHYRKEITFSYEALDGAATAYQKLLDWSYDNQTAEGKIDPVYMEKFDAHLFDDLGTAQAISEMWNLIKDDTVSKEDRYITLMKMSDVLGLNLQTAHKEEVAMTPELENLLSLRKTARADKNFEEADRLRDEILSLGFVVKDTPEGQALVTR